MNKEVIKDLLQKQKVLDDYIIEKQQLTLSFVESYTNRVLALSVELGELANEVRSFKHWSTKGPSEKSVLLEEYVDGLHFLLSITNNLASIDDTFVGVIYYECRSTTFDTLEISKQELNEMFIVTNHAILSLYLDYITESGVIETLLLVWELFGTLGGALGFSDDEVLQAYDEKYRKNIERQNTGY